MPSVHAVALLAINSNECYASTNLLQGDFGGVWGWEGDFTPVIHGCDKQPAVRGPPRASKRLSSAQPWPRTERKVRRHRPVLDRVLYRAQLSQTALIP
jgi:hypothetical protein